MNHHLIPGSVLFWSGPAHNEFYYINNPQVRIAVPPSLNWSIEEPAELMPSIEVIEYTAHVFAWFWKKEHREAIVMIPGGRNDSAATIEVEAVMEFLRGLWETNDERRKDIFGR